MVHSGKQSYREAISIYTHQQCFASLNYLSPFIRSPFQRGPNDLLPIANGGILVMTADSDAKKAKLDSSVALGGAVSAGGAPPCFAPSTAVVPSTQTQCTSSALFPTVSSGHYMAALTGPATLPNLNGHTDPAQITMTNTRIEQPKSKVVHLRNIPSDFTDLELLQFCMPFGRIVNYLLLKGKNQAFVEYESLDEAQRIVLATEAYPTAVRGRTMFVQYSMHQELKTDRSPPSQPTITTDEVSHFFPYFVNHRQSQHIPSGFYTGNGNVYSSHLRVTFLCSEILTHPTMYTPDLVYSMVAARRHSFMITKLIIAAVSR
uniref:RRM domain-containing protein n=1 Tax=Steinernema glaseri TaxID=37863 RepID=A0A1I7ZRC0_9BILA